MTDCKEHIKTAREEREKGDLNKSLEMFMKIERSQLEDSQLFDYLGELGLTYFHLKDFDKAKDCYEQALNVANKLDNYSYKAVTLRQLSKKEFNQGDDTKSLEYAMQARDMALKASRKDLVWFDDAVISVLLDKNTSREEVEKWILIATEDLINPGLFEKDETAKWVWFTGILMNRAKQLNSKVDLNLAMFVAEQFGLERRKEQITELITKLF